MLLKRATKKVKKLLLLNRSNDAKQRQDEIVHLQRQLAEFDIQFSILADRPSGVETQVLMEISKTVAQNNELLKILSAEGELSGQELLACDVDISPKILQEHQQFIVTMAHIFGGPYPCLRKYIRNGIT